MMNDTYSGRFEADVRLGDRIAFVEVEYLMHNDGEPPSHWSPGYAPTCEVVHVWDVTDEGGDDLVYTSVTRQLTCRERGEIERLARDDFEDVMAEAEAVRADELALWLEDERDRLIA